MSITFNTIISKVRATELRHLTVMGLTMEDAEDVFQEASVALYDVMSSQRLAMRSTPEAYLHGICQNMAYKRMEELKKLASVVDDDKLDRLLALTEEETDAIPQIMEDESDVIDYRSLLAELLEALTPRDFSLIHGFYIEGKSLEVLATENGMASVEVARTTKCRIMSRLREQASQTLKKYY